MQRELGGYLARLHRIGNPRALFGYPAVPQLSAPTWPDAFAAMLGALIDDANRYRVALPAADGELRAAVQRNTSALAAITTPALIHFDLWPGNILISPPDQPTAPRINGLIDGERVIWGDPLMEFVGMDVFGRADHDPDLRTGYTEAGGTIADDVQARRRLALYHLYMQLLLLIEIDATRLQRPGATWRLVGRECPQADPGRTGRSLSFAAPQGSYHQFASRAESPAGRRRYERSEGLAGPRSAQIGLRHARPRG